MTKADRIRQLSAKGLSVGDIAREVGVRYQHAYNVLKKNQPGRRPAVADVSSDLHAGKINLNVATLVKAGFQLSSQWLCNSAGELSLETPLPKEEGVYAFTADETVLYVGVATMGLAKRLNFYRKPGKTQSTSIRIKALLLDALKVSKTIGIYTVKPHDFDWHGLRMSGSVGLEVGIIECFYLPWNIRGAR